MARSTHGAVPQTQDSELAAGRLPHPNDFEVQDRGAAARDDQMAVVPMPNGVGEATGMYLVLSQSLSVYRVALDMGKCECPDQHHRGTRCKHLRRVAIEVNEHDLPTRGDAVRSYYEGRLSGMLTAFKHDLRDITFQSKPGQYRGAVDDALDTTKRFIEFLSEHISEWQSRFSDSEDDG